MAVGAGWFADPSGKINTFRWWDGRTWTRWLSADPAAPDPGPVPAGPPTNSGGMLAESVEAPYPPPDPADRVVGLRAAAAILIGGVLLAIIAVGAIISLTADRPLTGPAVAPPPPTVGPLAVAYDPVTRFASLQELKVVLPAAPFTCPTRPEKSEGLFASALQCGATVHEDYNAAKNDWGASSGVGLLEKGRETETDLRKLLASTASTLLARNYEVEDITIKKATNREFADVAPAGQARIVTAEIHVSYKGLPTKFDALQVTIFRLESGRHVVWWGFRPNDSPDALTLALRESYATLNARK